MSNGTKGPPDEGLEAKTMYACESCLKPVAQKATIWTQRADDAPVCPGCGEKDPSKMPPIAQIVGPAPLPPPKIAGT